MKNCKLINWLCSIIDVHDRCTYYVWGIGNGKSHIEIWVEFVVGLIILDIFETHLKQGYLALLYLCDKCVGTLT